MISAPVPGWTAARDVTFLYVVEGVWNQWKLPFIEAVVGFGTLFLVICCMAHHNLDAISMGEQRQPTDAEDTPSVTLGRRLSEFVWFTPALHVERMQVYTAKMLAGWSVWLLMLPIYYYGANYYGDLLSSIHQSAFPSLDCTHNLSGVIIRALRRLSTF